MALNVQELFNTKLPAAIANNAAAAKEINAKFQLNITGEGGGNWFLDLTAPAIAAGEPGGADVTLTLAHDDFVTLTENPGNGMKLFFAGKLKVQGNQMLAMKLQKIFDLVK